MRRGAKKAQAGTAEEVELQKVVGAGLPLLNGNYVFYTDEEHPASLPVDLLADENNRPVMLPICVPQDLMAPCSDSFHQLNTEGDTQRKAVRALMFFISSLLDKVHVKGIRLYAELLVREDDCFPKQHSSDNRVRLAPDSANFVEAYGSSNCAGYRLWLYAPAGYTMHFHKAVLNHLYKHQHRANLISDEDLNLKRISMEPNEVDRLNRLQLQVNKQFGDEMKMAIASEEETPGATNAVSTKMQVTLDALLDKMKRSLHAP